MSFLSLIIKVGADTTGFNSGLKQAEQNADSFAGRFGAKFTRAFVGGVAITAIARFSRHLTEMADDIEKVRTEWEKLGYELDSGTVEKLNAIRDEKKYTGGNLKFIGQNFGIGFVTPLLKVMETLPLMMGLLQDWTPWNWFGKRNFLDDATESVAQRKLSMMPDAAGESEKGRGVFIEQRDAKRRKVLEEIANTQDEAYLKSLSSEERLLELTNRRKMLFDVLSEDQIKNTDMRLQAELELANLDKDIAGINLPKQPKPKQGATITLGGVNVDELSKIGVFNQASDSMVQSYADKILRVAESIDANTAAAAEPIL